MGINGLMSYLKKQNITINQEQDLKLVKFSKIAIDTPLFLYKVISTHNIYRNKPFFQEKGWLLNILTYLETLRRKDLHPVFIFEGIAPIEKQETQKKRAETRVKVIEKTKRLKNELQKMDSTLLSCRTENELQKMDSQPASFDFDNEKHNSISDEMKLYRKKVFGDEINFNHSILKECIEKRERYDFQITSEDYTHFKQLLKICNIPFINAPIEAESFCAYLRKKNLVDFIVSNDSDILVYTENMITDFDFYKNKYTITNIRNIMNQLKFSKDQFIDFCIMCGTDYNKNIYKVGPSKSFSLLTEFGIIENLPTTYDTTILNFKRVRDIFNLSNLNFNILDYKIPYCGKPKWDELLLFLQSVNIHDEVDKVSFKGFFEHTQVLEVFKY